MSEGVRAADIILRQNEQRFSVHPPCPERADGVFRSRTIERQTVDDQNFAFGRAGRQRGTQRCRLHLFRDGGTVIARLGAESDAAALPLWFANRAVTRAPGALLTPRLRAAARGL